MTPAVLDTLRAAERYVNPAIALGLQLEAEGVHNPEDVFRHEAAIHQVIAEAEDEILQTQRVVAALRRATPAPGVVPVGF